MFTNRNQKRIALALVLSTCVSAYSASAQPGGRSDKRHGPPPEAFEACAELASGDSCETVGRRGESLAGICTIPREDEETLVCVPENAPDPSEHEK